MVTLEEMRRRFIESPCAKAFGMDLVDLSPGYARVKMTLKKDYLNWENLIQGGILVVLLDQAFGCAVNTMENIHVAVQLNTHFIVAAPVGETLCAEARVLHAGKKIGTTEMFVTDSKGRTIAIATGTTASLGPRT